MVLSALLPQNLDFSFPEFEMALFHFRKAEINILERNGVNKKFLEFDITKIYWNYFFVKKSICLKNIILLKLDTTFSQRSQSLLVFN